MRTPERQTEPLLFRLGDYPADILTGVLTALAVRIIVGSNWGMVMAMRIGMGVRLSLLVLLIPLLSAFEVMKPGGIIGMYGGMLLDMRDAMQQDVISLSQALTVVNLREAGVHRQREENVYLDIVKAIEATK